MTGINSASSNDDLIRCLAHDEPLEDESGYHGFCPKCAEALSQEKANFMNPKEKLRMLELEDAITEAINTITFLHDCLLNEKFVYQYPEQTFSTLLKLSCLVPQGPLCIHSKITEGCEACDDRLKRSRSKQMLRFISSKQDEA